MWQSVRNILLIAAVLLVLLQQQTDAAGCSASAATYATKKYGGTWRFTKDGTPIVLRGVSMTGWETGTRTTESGGGFWLFECTTAAIGATMMKNIVDALYGPWKMNVIRMPICGSAWLQNYAMQSYMGTKDLAVDYHTWVSQAVCYAVEKGMATIIDNHLWAIAKETVTVKNQGVEDGCTGYEAAPPDNKIDSCAPRDWYGAYTAGRNKKSYNSGDQKNVWQCPIANADGVTLDTLFKTAETYEHFLNLWWEVATYFKGSSAVWFELFNEPYQRKSADFGILDPLGPGLGANIPEAEWAWEKWTQYNSEAITIIRGITDQIILVSGHDWSYDYLGDHSSATGGPLIRQEKLLPWATGSSPVKNIGYAFHPYQHGTCCGKIGSSSDESKTDPYQSAFCLYPPRDGGKRKASLAALPSQITAISAKTCDTIGYADTQNKKGPPCIWKADAMMYPLTDKGLCAGDRDECAFLDETACKAKQARWQDPDTGGWSKYVLPMQFFGPLIATEFGPFDCSSAFSEAFMTWCRQFGVSYTVWALWPQNSGGPGAGACGYPSILAPNSKGNFGFCSSTCTMDPLPWSAPLIKTDIGKGQDTCDTTPCEHGACVSGSCKCKTGFSGTKCETRKAGFDVCSPNPCKNGGTCVPVGPATEADTFLCICPKTFYGVTCMVPAAMRGEGVKCTSSMCKNGGTCNDPTTYQLVCKCPPGKNTPDCGEDGGSSDTCSTSCVHGTQAAAPDCSCACQTGWKGTDCSVADDKPTCTTSCKNGGVLNADCTCDCSGTGYSGSTCSTKIPVDCTLSCGSHGGPDSACTKCVCTGGYTGSKCTVAPVTECDPDVCAHGSCSGTKCQCDAGWSGTNCDTPVCDETCENGGTCGVLGDGTVGCKCKSGYSGSDCSQTCSICKNGGTPNSACTSCTCTSQWQGPKCTISSSADLCASTSNPCGTHGTCSDSACDCKPGYTGQYCDTIKCSPTCSSHGSCKAQNDGSAICVCASGWGGASCSTAGVTNNTTSSGGDNTLLIVIIVLLALVVIGGIAYFMYRQRQQQQQFQKNVGGFQQQTNTTAYPQQTASNYRPPPPPGPTSRPAPPPGRY